MASILDSPVGDMDVSGKSLAKGVLKAPFVAIKKGAKAAGRGIKAPFTWGKAGFKAGFGKGKTQLVFLLFEIPLSVAMASVVPELWGLGIGLAIVGGVSMIVIWFETAQEAKKEIDEEERRLMEVAKGTGYSYEEVMAKRLDVIRLHNNHLEETKISSQRSSISLASLRAGTTCPDLVRYFL